MTKLTAQLAMALFGPSAPSTRTDKQATETAPAAPVRLDMAQMRLYPRGLSREDAIVQFKQAYHKEPEVIIKPAEAWCLGPVPDKE